MLIFVLVYVRGCALLWLIGWWLSGVDGVDGVDGLGCFAAIRGGVVCLLVRILVCCSMLMLIGLIEVIVHTIQSFFLMSKFQHS